MIECFVPVKAELSFKNVPFLSFLNFFFFLNFQDKESVSENPVLDLPCSIG